MKIIILTIFILTSFFMFVDFEIHADRSAFLDLLDSDRFRGIAVNSETNMIYVSSMMHNVGVVVLDGLTNEVISKINLDLSEQIAVNSETNVVYVAQGRSLNQINGNSNQIESQLEISKIYEITINPNTQKLYVSTSSGIIVLDTISDQNFEIWYGVVNEYGADFVTHTPKSMDFNPETNLLYVVAKKNPWNPTIPETNLLDSVFVIDVRTGNVVNIIENIFDAYSLKVNTKTNTIYVTNYYDDFLYVIDGHTNEINTTIKTSGSPAGIAIDEKKDLIFVGTFYDFHVIDAQSNTVIDTISELNRVSSVTVNPVTGIVYTNHYKEGISVVSTLDPQTGAITQIDMNPLTLEQVSLISLILGQHILGIAIPFLLVGGIFAVVYRKESKTEPKKVNIKLQIILALIPLGITQLFACARIRKLRWGVVLLFINSSFFAIMLALAVVFSGFMTDLTPIFYILPASGAVIILPIVVIRKWSLEWNGQFSEN